MQALVQGYDELRLRIHSRDGNSYDVHASTRAAEASARFELPFSDLELENFILKVSQPRAGMRSVQSSALGDAQRFGGELFKALFSGEIYRLYQSSLTEARNEHRGVRITLCLSGSPELIDVPWEYLFDEPDFLAVSAFTPVVRYLDLPRRPRPLTVRPPLRVLGVISNPRDAEQLGVEREQENLERALADLSNAGAIELRWLETATLNGLLDALQTEQFHALHFVGHGLYDRTADEGVLLFEQDDGWGDRVSGDRLGTILKDFRNLRLVILNACEGARSARTDPFAGVAGAIVRREVPAVVAMQFQISDDAAIAFSGGFYERLAAGYPVDASVSAARLAMFAKRSDDIEWGTPVLFMRVPDGQIFQLDRQRQVAGGHGVPTNEIGAGPNGAAVVQPQGALTVFINHRRDDSSGHAKLLSDRLGQQFGDASIRAGFGPGSDSRQLTDTGTPAAFVTLIGPSWTSSIRAASGARHLEDSARRDLESALRDAPGFVIPVLIDAQMPPPERLPRSLRGLCRLEPLQLRDASFDQDLEGLIARLRRLTPPTPPAWPSRRSVAAETAELRPSTSRQNRAQAVSGVTRAYPGHYSEVIDGMLDAMVVPVLGPGLRGSSPNSDHLASPLAEQFGIPISGLSAVAQRVAMTLGERRLYAALRDLIEAESQPTVVHRFLAEMRALMRARGLPPRPQLIITTGYDSGLERAFEDVHEPFDYAVYIASRGRFVHVPWGEHSGDATSTEILEPRKYVGFPIDDDGELERTIIVKIHGGADGHEGNATWRNNYVVTEDQFIDYLPTDNIQDHLPIQILDKLTGSRCLFLGYVLTNWCARVFVRRIWREKPISESSWAVEHDPDALEKASWSARGHVELLTASFPDYVDGLRSALADRPDGSDIRLA